MRRFEVIERFVSIDGEGPMAGMLAVFVRFKGCNLRCSWCDTTYSWEKEASSESMSSEEIYQYIKSTGVNHVTLTGGEPLAQEGIEELLEILAADKELLVHIETNGSISIAELKKNNKIKNIRYIVDYKLPASKMTENMSRNNLEDVEQTDTYKFVIADQIDLQKAYEIIRAYNLDTKCQVYLSPVAENILPMDIVEFMKEKNLIHVRLQLQLHKIIWPKECRGV